MSSLNSIFQSIQKTTLFTLSWVYVTFGVTGCILNILLFSRKQFRATSCCKYFFVASIGMLCNLLIYSIPTIYGYYYANPITYNIGFCKFRSAASFDRFALSSSNTSLRNLANIKFAYKVIASIIILVLLEHIYIRERRQVITNQQVIINKNQKIQRKRDQQVLKMLFAQIIAFFIITLPLMIYSINSIISPYILNKSTDRVAIESFITSITGGLSYVFPAVSFYLYTLTSNQTINALNYSCNKNDIGVGFTLSSSFHSAWNSISNCSLQQCNIYSPNNATYCRLQSTPSPEDSDGDTNELNLPTPYSTDGGETTFDALRIHGDPTKKNLFALKLVDKLFSEDELLELDPVTKKNKLLSHRIDGYYKMQLYNPSTDSWTILVTGGHDVNGTAHLLNNNSAHFSEVSKGVIERSHCLNNMENYKLQFREVLIDILDRLSDIERKKLSFLLVDDIDRRICDDPTIGGALDLIQQLFDRNKISEENFTYLIQSFERIKCYQASNSLKATTTSTNSNDTQCEEPRGRSCTRMTPTNTKLEGLGVYYENPCYGIGCGFFHPNCRLCWIDPKAPGRMDRPQCPPCVSKVYHEKD
ncbi:hypothetical protein I4U23_027127 [Adineta vaga]|nr:hypothetical protein I4U23_027127 [Adineta vaga]